MLNTLLLYPDHPYGLGYLYGHGFDPDSSEEVKFLIAQPGIFPRTGCIKRAPAGGGNQAGVGRGTPLPGLCRLHAETDVTARLQAILEREGIRTAVLRASVDTSKREAWYDRQLKEGVQVVIGHPKLVETGLDLLDFPTIIFYESGYSLHTLRQASRRSWRIGQSEPVRVKFLCYEGTMQASCLRLMGKKLLVALTMEGKFAGEGLQTLDEDDDMLSAMARELVEKNGIGESADADWRSLNEEHQKLFPATHAAVCEHDDGGLEQEHSDAAALVETAIPSAPAVLFGQRAQDLHSRRRPRSVPPEQGSLFNWN